jgi:GTP 3',8-cyclase
MASGGGRLTQAMTIAPGQRRSPRAAGTPAASVADTMARPVRDLRISVTDRCQFRCTYCMPRDVFGRGFAFLPRQELLTFEELARLARVFAGLGVRKLRLTGGEPMLRRDLERLIAMLAAIAASRTSP